MEGVTLLKISERERTTIRIRKATLKDLASTKPRHLTMGQWGEMVLKAGMDAIAWAESEGVA